MAVKYKGPKAVLSGMYDDSVAVNDFWTDLNAGFFGNRAWVSNFTNNWKSNFSNQTSDWGEAEFRQFFKDNGIESALQEWLGRSVDDLDLTMLRGLMGSMVMDKLGAFTANKYQLSASEKKDIRNAIKNYNFHNQIVTDLRDNKGGTDQQIQAVIDQLDQNPSAYETFYEETKDLSGDAWNNYVEENFSEGNVLPDNTWGAGDSSYTISDAGLAEGQAETPTEQAQAALDTETFGDATNPDGLTAVEGTTDQFTDADGKTVYLGSDGKYRYEDGKEYISPDQNTVPREIESDQASSDAAEDVVDEAVQNVAAGADTAANIQTSVLGGDVSTGVAEQLGWQKGTKEVDGKTVTTFTDPRTNTTYDVDPDSGMLTDTEGNTVSTVGSLNFEENDFAQQFTDAANEFLYGSAITPENAASKGFTLSDDGTYIGPDGRSYTVGKNNTLVDEDGNALRTDGFRDYQTQMQEANATYQSEMGTLRGDYEQAYASYESELNPYRDQMDQTTAGLMEVARDANDTNYYGRLTDLYYQDSKEEIDRNTRGAQETLNSTYANAGMDPNSPAYTQAIMDLESKRADSSRSARRQAILDSYGLGTQMLTNRTNALSNAQVGIGRSMDALSDLYDVKLEGLGVERDMISTIYGGKMDAAKMGIEGLNVSTALQQDIINANQSSYFKDLDVRTGLNQNTVDTNVTAANTGGAADANATDDYWTGMGWLQTLVDNDFDWRAAGAAIQTQFPDFDTSTLDEKLQEKFGFK